MHSISRFGSTFGLTMVLLLVTVMVAIIGVFVLFEQQSTLWISTMAEDLLSSGGVWLLAVFLVAALACDIVLPIPSSIVAVLAATTLGFWGGAGVIWLGLMLSCCAGYLMAAVRCWMRLVLPVLLSIGASNCCECEALCWRKMMPGWGLKTTLTGQTPKTLLALLPRPWRY